MLPIISILMSIWLYREAKYRNDNKYLWSLFGLLFSFLAIGVFHLRYRNRIQGIFAIVFGVFIYSLVLYDYFNW